MALYCVVDRPTTSAGGVEAKHYHCPRINAVRALMRRLAYEALRAGGYLDTRHAHTVMATVDDCPEHHHFQAGHHILCWWRVE